MRRAFWRSLPVLALLGLTAPAQAAPVGATLLASYGPGGTIGLPVPGSEYENPMQLLSFHSLPLEQLLADANHRRFINIQSVPGGSFGGGQRETFGSEVVFTFRREGEEGPGVTVVIPALCETHTSRQEPWGAHQVLQTAMWSLQGGVENQGGWEYLSVTAGTAHGLPSPGVTTLNRREDGLVVVTSEFNIRYRIEYRGAADGPFAGLEGAAEGEVLMRAFPGDAAGGGAAPVAGD